MPSKFKATTGDPTGISSTSLIMVFHCYMYLYYTITNHVSVVPWGSTLGMEIDVVALNEESFIALSYPHIIWHI